MQKNPKIASVSYRPPIRPHILCIITLRHNVLWHHTSASSSSKFSACVDFFYYCCCWCFFFSTPYAFTEATEFACTLFLYARTHTHARTHKQLQCECESAMRFIVYVCFEVSVHRPMFSKCITIYMRPAIEYVHVYIYKCVCVFISNLLLLFIPLVLYLLLYSILLFCRVFCFLFIFFEKKI